MNNVTLYIPSAGRAQWQHTYRRLPKAWRAHTVIVVPKGEAAAYRERVKRAEVVECPVRGIGKTRQWIIDENESKYIMMLDDDMYFYTREEHGSIKLRTCEFSDVEVMLNWLMRCMQREGYIHGGVGKRTEASFYLCSYREVARINNFHFLRGREIARLKKHGIRFDVLPLMEDFHFTLSLFEMGYPNLLTLDYVWNQPGSNTQGGCSTYRTPEMQAKASHMLHDLHPDVVKVVEKKTRSASDWEGMKVRTDVIIQWRQAYSGEHRPHWIAERASVRK